MLEELRRDVFVDVVLEREFERDAHEVERVHRHPGGAVGLADEAAGRQRLRAIEHPDIVEPEEAALEDVAPVLVLAVHPPGEVQHELVEHPLQEGAVALAGQRQSIW